MVSMIFATEAIRLRPYALTSNTRRLLLPNLKGSCGPKGPRWGYPPCNNNGLRRVLLTAPLLFSGICSDLKGAGGRRLMSDMKPEIIEGDLAESRDEVTEPPLYKVLIHNDDYTTKDFVVELLVVVFNKSLEEATQVMWQTHRNGTGLCGIYPLEVAETKVKVVTEAARESGFPLKLTIEEE